MYIQYYTFLVCMFFEIEFRPGNLNLLIANENCNVSWCTRLVFGKAEKS